MQLRFILFSHNKHFKMPTNGNSFTCKNKIDNNINLEIYIFITFPFLISRSESLLKN